MRLTDSNPKPSPVRKPRLSRIGTDAALCEHPTLRRALTAHVDDQIGGIHGFSASPGFMRSVRRDGIDRSEIAMTIGKGVRSMRWDGRVLVRDRFLGIELELDPSGTIGIDVRRVG